MKSYVARTAVSYLPPRNLRSACVTSLGDLEDAEAIAATTALETLYTQHVFPQGMLDLWNNGLGAMRHRLKPGGDPVEERPRVVNLLVQWIVGHLLHVDSHPTLTRFFTFRGCTDRMLTMSLIDMPRHAFKVRSIKPRKENQKRRSS